MKPDRDFMIAIRQNWPAGNIASEGAQQDDLFDFLPPIDVYINAVHRLVQLQILPDTEFALQATIQNINRKDTMSFDHDGSIFDILRLLDGEGLLHYLHPNDIDINFFYFNQNSVLGETLISSDYYKNFLHTAAQAGRLISYPDQMGSAITIGELDMITILECRVA